MLNRASEPTTSS